MRLRRSIHGRRQPESLALVSGCSGTGFRRHWFQGAVSSSVRVNLGTPSLFSEQAPVQTKIFRRLDGFYGVSNFTSTELAFLTAGSSERFHDGRCPPRILRGKTPSSQPRFFSSQRRCVSGPRGRCPPRKLRVETLSRRRRCVLRHALSWCCETTLCRRITTAAVPRGNCVGEILQASDHVFYGTR
jgi:hypothetical protein